MSSAAPTQAWRAGHRAAPKRARRRRPTRLPFVAIMAAPAGMAPGPLPSGNGGTPASDEGLS